MKSQNILIIWFSILFIITGFVVYEFASFSQNNIELNLLKDEYRSLISELKEAINKKKSTFAEASVDKLDNPSKMVETKKVFAPKIKRIIKKKVNYTNPEANLAHLYREPVFFWPLKKSEFWISSKFGPRKKADGSEGYHWGIDMAAIRGTLVKSAGSGVVIESGYNTGYGNTILISHNDKFKTRYAHLDKIFVKVGQKVSAKEYIGQVGSTGSVRARGKSGDPSHLHFEVYLYNKQVNPLYFLK